MVGRKPLGPGLVEHLDGSANAKERLELILGTIAGRVSVVAAAERLGISEAMFYKLRNRVLQVSLADLEPKPIGRPTQSRSEESLQREALAEQVTELQRELAAQTVQLELAQTIPQVLRSSSDSVKKTLLFRQRKQRLKRKQR